MANIPRPQNLPNKLEIKVSRANIFEDSFRIISAVTCVDLLKTKLWIEFDGEEVLGKHLSCHRIDTDTS